MRFTAIDVETANADLASICQIGVAKFEDDKLVDEWSSLVDPEDYFNSMNVHIHGIGEDDVSGAPTFPKIVDTLSSYLADSICVSHTRFDRVSIWRAANKYSLIPIETVWLDSARVARRTWAECARRGYGLRDVCKIIGYEFKHHDALEDAKACGQVLIAAMKQSGLDVDYLLAKSWKPIGLSDTPKDANPEGELYGEVIVFTGSLEIPRREAKDFAASIGCAVGSSVTKKTSILVVGDRDVTRFAGKVKSSKHLKAEQLIAKDQQIRILKESDFKELFKSAQENT